MSRLDLDQIQSQLKIAIQNHQVLVSRIQLQPQDMGLKSQLHNLQKEIIQMSQKQKLVVQKLRLELIDRQSTTPPQNIKQLTTTTTSHSSKLSVAISTSSVSKSPLSSHSPLVKSCDEQNEPPPVECSETQNQPQQQSTESTPNPVSSQKSSTSPIRVPQYPGSRTSVLKNSNSIHTIENKSCKLQHRKQYIDRDSWSGKDVHKTLEVTNKDKELKEKLDFLARLELVPPESLKDVQNKRSERKRRSTNNPNFAYGFELERRPRLSNYIGNDYFGAKKPKVRSSVSKNNDASNISSPPCTPENGNGNSRLTPRKDDKGHANLCSVCGVSGQLLLCDTCSCVYHLRCLDPPLDRVPQGHWSCPKCQEGRRKSALAAVNSYIASKTAKEEEKRKLLKRSTELLQEKTQLESRTKQLNEILARQGIRKHDLIELNRKAQQSVENLKNFVKAVQSS